MVYVNVMLFKMWAKTNCARQNSLD